MTDQMLKITLQAARQRRIGGSSGLEFSKLKDERQEILGKMSEALNISLSLLIDGSRTDSEGKPDHMILSRAQTEALLNYLHSQFPTLKNEQTGERSGDFIGQAALIQAFLSGKYKSADR
jgi:hypothetical protein